MQKGRKERRKGSKHKRRATSKSVINSKFVASGNAIYFNLPTVRSSVTESSSFCSWRHCPLLLPSLYNQPTIPSRLLQSRLRNIIDPMKKHPARVSPAGHWRRHHPVFSTGLLFVHPSATRYEKKTGHFISKRSKRWYNNPLASLTSNLISKNLNPKIFQTNQPGCEKFSYVVVINCMNVPNQNHALLFFCQVLCNDFVFFAGKTASTISCHFGSTLKRGAGPRGKLSESDLQNLPLFFFF